MLPVLLMLILQPGRHDDIPKNPSWLVIDPLSVRLPTSPSTLSCGRRQVLADDKAVADDAATAPCIESSILRPPVSTCVYCDADYSFKGD